MPVASEGKATAHFLMAARCAQGRSFRLKEVSPTRTLDTNGASAIKALFRSLPGWWSLNRVIAGYGKMDGRARFTALDEQTLHYREDGEMRLESGRSFSAFQDLLYCLEKDAIAVRCQWRNIPQDLLFHLRPECSGPEIWPARATSTHYCSADTYEGEYYFERPDRLRTRIRVRGPRKDAVILSLFTRLKEASAH